MPGAGDVEPLTLAVAQVPGSGVDVQAEVGSIPAPVSTSRSSSSAARLSRTRSRCTGGR
jgi:hypothetical protein